MTLVSNNTTVGILYDIENAPFEMLNYTLGKARRFQPCRTIVISDWDARPEQKRWDKLLRRPGFTFRQISRTFLGKNSLDSALYDSAKLLYDEGVRRYFVITTDSDFVRIAEMLNSQEKSYIIGVGTKQASEDLRNAYDEFIVYPPEEKKPAKSAKKAAKAAKAEAGAEDDGKKHGKDLKEQKDHKDHKDHKHVKENKEKDRAAKAAAKAVKAEKDSKDNKDSKEIKENQEAKAVKTRKAKAVKAEAAPAAELSQAAKNDKPAKSVKGAKENGRQEVKKSSKKEGKKESQKAARERAAADKAADKTSAGTAPGLLTVRLPKTLRQNLEERMLQEEVTMDELVTYLLMRGLTK